MVLSPLPIRFLATFTSTLEALESWKTPKVEIVQCPKNQVRSNFRDIVCEKIYSAVLLIVPRVSPNTFFEEEASQRFHGFASESRAH